MPRLRADAPRLNLKSIIFEERYKEIPIEYHVTPLSKKFTGYPITSKDDIPKDHPIGPATKSGFFSSNYPALASLNDDYRKYKDVKPYDNPNMTT